MTANRNSDTYRLQVSLIEAQKQILDLKERLAFVSSTFDGGDVVQTAIDQTLEGIQIVGFDWRYLYLNQAAANHGRTVKADLIGRTMMDCYPGIEMSSGFELMKQVMVDRKHRSMENLFEFPNGDKVWFELIVEPHTVGILIRSIDITKKKKLEEDYLHSQKLEAIGQLAGGIAHDFNNKLGIMLAYSDMTLDLLEPNSRAHSHISNVVKAIDQAAALTKQLLAFSRKQVLDFRIVDLNSLVTSSLEGLPKLLGENITVKSFLEEDLRCVHIDPSQMDQIILNLCINARDAIGKNPGTITVESANIDLDEEYCQTHSGVVPGEYVVLSVSDTGIGMPPEVKSRIFEPFFTTKEAGAGTGLGLPSVHGIVKQSRGHIWVYSEVGRGTTFKIYLPAVRETPAHIQDSKPTKLHVEGSELVLLVEDDPLLKGAYQQALEKAGYAVVSAGSAEEALECFTNEPGEFDILVTDVILPKKSGPELFADLRLKLPALKGIFVSGYTANTITHHAEIDMATVLLQKPVSIRQLLGTVRKVLDEG